MHLQKVISKKLLKTFFVGIFSTSDEKCWIRIRKSVVRIRIRTKMSRIHNIAFYPFKKMPLSSQKYGLGIRYPEKPIPDSGVKKHLIRILYRNTNVSKEKLN